MLHLCRKSHLRWAMPVLLLTGVSLALWGWGRSLIAQSQEPVAVSTSVSDAAPPSSNAVQPSLSIGVSQPPAAAPSGPVDAASDAAPPSSNAVQFSLSTGVSQPSAVSADPVDLAHPPVQDLGFDLLLHAAEPDSPELAALRQQYVEAERESLRLAAEYADWPVLRRARQRRPSSLGSNSSWRRSVQTAFDLRQRLQSGEVARLRERLQKVERRLETRSQLKDRIIGQRIEDLLNPDQRWDAGTGPEAVGPGPDMDLLRIVPHPRGSAIGQRSVWSADAAPVPVPIISGAPALTSLPGPGIPLGPPPEMMQAQVMLRLVELPSELARGLGLPKGGQRPALLRDSGAFESALSSAQSTGRVRILRKPQLVATMGQKAQLHVGGLEAEVCPHRYEAGELQLSVDFTKRISGESLPVDGAPTEQTYHAQADLTLTPEKVAIVPLDPQHDTDRWTYLLVQARPLYAGPLAAQTTAPYLPVPYGTPYATAPAVPPRAPDAPAPPSTIDPWPRKLPSEYFNQRQQIIDDVTEQVRQSMRQRIESGADEVEDVRLGVLVRQAEKRLALLTQEFDSQRHVYESQLQAQQAALELRSRTWNGWNRCIAQAQSRSRRRLRHARRLHKHKRPANRPRTSSDCFSPVAMLWPVRRTSQ